MTPQPASWRRDRLASAAIVAAVHLLLAWALLSGLGVVPAISAPDTLRMLPVSEPPLAPAIVLQPELKPKPQDPEGAAAPPALRATPTEIVAPEPEIPLPPPIAAAPLPGTGAAPSAGASLFPGPGTGSGGEGQGLGNGTSGNGTGAGGGGGGPSRWLRGSIDDGDYPRRAYDDRVTGTVFIAFTVDVDGRARDCRVTRSSGSRALDETTCRLIEKRFRYRPARDGGGRPVASTIRGEQEWAIGPAPPDREVEPELVPD
jgi:protein TonB